MRRKRSAKASKSFRGDPNMVAAAADSREFEHKYRSIVMAFPVALPARLVPALTIHLCGWSVWSRESASSFTSPSLCWLTISSTCLAPRRTFARRSFSNPGHFCAAASGSILRVKRVKAARSSS